MTSSIRKLKQFIGAILFACLLVTAGFNSISSAQTANPNASDDAKKVLLYLKGLKSKTNNRLLLGQDLGHGGDISDNYNNYVTALENSSGRELGLLGGDYGLYPGHVVSESNQKMIQQWGRGGLVTLSWSFNNPWTGGSCWDLGQSNNLYDLLGGGTAADTWTQQLDEVAEALQPLKSAGVVVLWRPLHEMNGEWFWWGKKGFAGHEQAFIDLYRDMFNYLTYEKGLDNLLWVYSVGNTYYANSQDYYPGSNYVDVVGIDIYDNWVRFKNADENGNVYPGAQDHYNDLVAFNKPMGLTEFGPSHALSGNGNYNYMQLVNAVRSYYPDVVFSYSWHDYYDNTFVSNGVEYHSISSNANTTNTLRDPLVANLADIDLGNTGLSTGKIRLKNRYSEKHLAASSYLSRRFAATYVWQPGHLSMDWYLEATDQPDTYRLRSGWKHPSHPSNYLHGTSTANGTRIRVWEDKPWYWQRWKLERVEGNFYRLKNVISNKYLNGDLNNIVTTYNFNENWWSQMWELEYVD